MIKISLKQSCHGLDSCSFVTAVGGLWQGLLIDARVRSWLHGQGSRAGLLPRPAHSHPWHSPLAFLLPALASGELALADARQAAWVLVSVSTHTVQADGMCCCVFSLWIMVYGMLCCIFLLWIAVRCLRTLRVWSRGSSPCISRWAGGFWSYFWASDFLSKEQLNRKEAASCKCSAVFHLVFTWGSMT